LFLGKGSKKSEYIQLFIEPKGSHIEDGDRWKEDFLKEIGNEKEVKNLFEDDKYIIYGLPFYQENKKLEFMKALEKITN
jgi:type III restriction enzyme